MAFDPNMNIGVGGASCDSLDLPDWCENEESFDLSTFISSNRNLELCNDELFEALFPPNSPATTDIKKDKTDKEVEHWSNQAPLASHPTSACSSTTTSPAMQNYYNTPPVTPRTELHRSSPHHLQYDGLTVPMASSRLALLNSSNHQTLMQLGAPSSSAALKSSQPLVKQEPNDPSTSHLAFAVSRNQAVPGPSLFQNERNSIIQNDGQPSLGHGSKILNHSSITSNNQESSALVTKRTQDSPFPVTAKKSKPTLKGSDEYFEKRKRNNVAVRRSRDKAKKKALETQNRVNELTNENIALRRRIAELSNELSTLKGLLTSSVPQAGNQGM